MDETLTETELAAIQEDEPLDEASLDALRRIADGEAKAPEPEPAEVLYQAELPADHAERASSLARAEDELKRAFRMGELEFDDFEAQRAELLREREELTVARAKVEVSEEMRAQALHRQWTGAIGKFMSKVAADIDYRADAERLAELDTFVKTLAGDPRHAHRPMDWFLTEAHKRVLALNLHGALEQQARFDQVDASATRDIGRLGGFDYEDALARMTPAQREQFARG